MRLRDTLFLTTSAYRQYLKDSISGEHPRWHPSSISER